MRITNLLLIFLILVLSACASTGPSLDRISDNLYPGDSTKRALILYGNPNFELPSIKVEGARAWYWIKDQQICAITFKDEQLLAVKGCTHLNAKILRQLQAIARTEILPQYRDILYR